MAALQCVCGDVFTASCDIEPTGCTIAWLLLLLSAVAHAMQYCTVENLRDRPPLSIWKSTATAWKSTATALYHNSHTRPAQDHNSALLLLLQSLNLHHRSYRYSYKLHILMHARSNLAYARRVKFTLQLPFR